MLKKEGQRFQQTIVDLKTKLEESKRVEDSLTQQLMTNIREKENREAETVSLKNKFQTKDIAKGYENSSKVLENIISNQNPFFNKTSIGYKQNTNEASSSIFTDNEKKPRRYVEVVKDYKNEEEIEC